jgi:hypothetical protein
MTDLQDKVKKAWETIEAQNPGVLDAPVKKSGNKRIAASIPPELYNWINEISEKEGDRFGFVVRWILQMGLYSYEEDFNSDLHSFIHQCIFDREDLFAMRKMGGAKSEYDGLERDGNVIFFPFPQQGSGQGA